MGNSVIFHCTSYLTNLEFLYEIMSASNSGFNVTIAIISSRFSVRGNVKELLQLIDKYCFFETNENMKFGKDLKKRKVPEWTEAYVDYNGLKRILQDICNSNQNKPSVSSTRVSQQSLTELRDFTGFRLHNNNFNKEQDIESQAIAVHAVQQEDCRKLYNTKLLGSLKEGEEAEVMFFKKLDEELNKTCFFYKDKVEEVMREATLLERQMEALIALRIKVMNPDFDGSLKCLSTDINNGIGQIDRKICVEMSYKNHFESHSSNGVDMSFQSQDSGSQAQCSTASMENSVDNSIDAANEILDHVKISKTCNSPISTIRGVLEDSREKDLTYKKEELKEVEDRLKLAFVEFYMKLCLLKHYSFMNISAFSKILKKYEKVTSRCVARSYMEIVDNSYIGCSDEVSCLMERVELVFIKNFSNSNRREGMKILRPKQKKEKHRITFFSGFLSGCSLALLVAVVLLIEDRSLIHKKGASSYMHLIFPLYSFYAYIVLHMLVYAANIYFWRRYMINYTFIFGFKQGTELGYKEVFLLTNGLAVIALGTFLVHLHVKMDSRSQHYETYIELLPLALVIVVLAITLCPFNIIYCSSRFFLIKCVFRCICAPFYTVTLPDFFLADQFTSQIQAIRSFEYYICFYGGKKSSQNWNKCSGHDLYTIFYFIVAVVPYWFRFLQCVRRLFEEKDYVHGCNGLRYFFTIVAVVIRTAFEQKKITTWKVLAVVSSAIATIINTYWDIVVDWGLLQRKSKNLFLRDKLVVSHKSVYFVAQVLDILLRFAWLQLVMSLDVQSLQGMTISTIFSCLEILRRGMWNFFRLENEHLNNVGKYRAFKTVPLPFTYYSNNEDDDDDNIDKDD